MVCGLIQTTLDTWLSVVGFNFTLYFDCRRHIFTSSIRRTIHQTQRISLEEPLQITILLWLITSVILSSIHGEIVIDVHRVKFGYLLHSKETFKICDIAQWGTLWSGISRLGLSTISSDTMQLLALLAVVEVALGQWQQWGLKEAKEKAPAPNTDQESYSILTSIMLYPCIRSSLHPPDSWPHLCWPNHLLKWRLCG